MIEINKNVVIYLLSKSDSNVIDKVEREKCGVCLCMCVSIGLCLISFISDHFEKFPNDLKLKNFILKCMKKNVAKYLKRKKGAAADLLSKPTEQTQGVRQPVWNDQHCGYFYTLVDLHF